MSGPRTAAQLLRAGRTALSRRAPFLKGLTRRYKMARAVVRNAWWPPSRSFQDCRDLFRERTGLEIGGPSPLFDRYGSFPIYPLLTRLDNCNFQFHTIWEGTIREGSCFHYDKRRSPGDQFVREAVDLVGVTSESYQVVLSSHCLEHIANPLRAMREWLRVLAPEGLIVLVVPHRDATCDHRRPVTTLAHMVDDFKRGRGEDDRTHVSEVLALHDIDRDADRPTREEFVRRTEANATNRALHHHVFVTETVAALMDHLGLQVLGLEPVRPLHIVAIGQKVPPGRRSDNARFFGDRAWYRSGSPFPSDRSAVGHGDLFAGPLLRRTDSSW